MLSILAFAAVTTVPAPTTDGAKGRVRVSIRIERAVAKVTEREWLARTQPHISEIERRGDDGRALKMRLIEFE